MSIFVVDVESDGPIPYDYSMISFGAVRVDRSLTRTFYGKLKPVSDNWKPEALAISGFSREETLTFDDPKEVMIEFGEWLKRESSGRPQFYSDNNGFDWQFINWYFIHFTGRNPFGYASQNISCLYKGRIGDMFKSHKHLRNTEHTHNPVDDAMGDAEALLKMKFEMGLKISLK